jgi:hypothetical protein
MTPARTRLRLAPFYCIRKAAPGLNTEKGEWAEPEQIFPV